MSAHPKPTDPRRHALRTLASLLVRHGPTPAEPDPADRLPPSVPAPQPEPANEAEFVRKAA